MAYMMDPRKKPLGAPVDQPPQVQGQASPGAFGPPVAPGMPTGGFVPAKQSGGGNPGAMTNGGGGAFPQVDVAPGQFNAGAFGAPGGSNGQAMTNAGGLQGGGGYDGSGINPGGGAPPVDVPPQFNTGAGGNIEPGGDWRTATAGGGVAGGGGNIEPGGGAPMPPAATTNRFNLEGAQVHGRAADIHDPNDLLWLASQQQGFDISSNEAAQRTYQSIIAPMLAQQGIQSQLGGRNGDRVVLPGGRTLDFIGNSSNADTSQRRFWVGDSAHPGGGGGPAAMTNAGAFGAPGGPVVMGDGGSGAPPVTVGGPPRTGIAPGWEDAGNGNVKNPATGQTLPMNHPAYQQILASAPGGGTAAPGPAGGGGPAGPQGALPDFVGQAMDLPENYNPAAVSGPDAWQGRDIAAERAQGGGQVSTPEALRAREIAAAGPFRATNADDLAADPGMQFRQRNTLAALQNAAGAKGLLRSGGTLQALMDKGGEMASQEFANVDARRRADYQTQLGDRLAVGQANNAANAQAYGLSNQYGQAAQMFNSGQAADTSRFNAQQGNTAQQANAANSLAAWQAYQGMRSNTAQFNAARTDTANQQNFANRFNVQNANQGNSLAAWQANTGARLGFGNLDNQRTQTSNAFTLGQGQLALGNRTADQNFSLGQGQLSLGNRQADQSFQLGQGQLGLGYYNADTSRQAMQGSQQLGWANYGLGADQQQFNQGYSLADMGLRAAGQYGGYAGQYGAQSGNNATQAGNAGAAGTVGAANAWGAGIGGAAGSASQAYAQWLASQGQGGGAAMPHSAGY